METSSIIALSASGVMLLGFFAIWFQQKKSAKVDQQAFREELRSLQEQLLRSQREQENFSEKKSTMLRQELSDQIQKSRVELNEIFRHTSQSLDNRVNGLDGKLEKRLGDLSKGVQDKLESNIREGFKYFDRIQDHLKHSGQQLQSLSHVGQSINDLNNLLKLPHLRGSFGEATLERLLADLLPTGSYELQYQVVPHSTERVDAVVRYPNALLPIDSKFPREKVLPLFETNDPQKLEAARKDLSDVMKSLGKQIRDKYIHPEHGTTDIALLFVPSETLYFEILRDIRLCEALSKLKIFTVSPNTLAISLNSVSMARDYYKMAQGVEKTITEVKKAKKHFENFEQRFADLGKHLKKTQDAYDVAVTHLGRYHGAVNRLSPAERTESLASPSSTKEEGPQRPLSSA